MIPNITININVEKSYDSLKKTIATNKIKDNLDDKTLEMLQLLKKKLEKEETGVHAEHVGGSI